MSIEEVDRPLPDGTEAAQDETRVPEGEDSAERASGRRDYIGIALRVGIVLVVLAVIAATVVIIREIPRPGEAPQTSAQAAINNAMAVIKENPSSVLARLALADAYFQHELYDEALLAIDDAASLEPTGTMAAYVEIGYGRVYEAAGDRASAVEHYEASLALDPSFDALYALGNIAEADGDLGVAADYWLRALEITPGAATLRIDLAAAYEGLGEYDSALAQLQEASRYLPNDPDIAAATERIQSQSAPAKP